MRCGHLFDGAGGLRRGFEQAGIETAWRIEILDGCDIREADPKKLGAVDIVAGGPSCVRTSALGNFHGKTTGESLWPEMLRIIEGLRQRPRWVSVEQPASVDPNIIVEWSASLQRIGYGVSARIIDSRHWLPQQRPRWILLGRMGIKGLALRDHLYADGRRGGRWGSESWQGELYIRNCPDCMPGGVLAGLSARKPALMGAGNAVSVPTAAWIASLIIEAERALNENALA